jgi:hypothetical protein
MRSSRPYARTGPGDLDKTEHSISDQRVEQKIASNLADSPAIAFCPRAPQKAVNSQVISVVGGSPIEPLSENKLATLEAEMLARDGGKAVSSLD